MLVFWRVSPVKTFGKDQPVGSVDEMNHSTEMTWHILGDRLIPEQLVWV